MDETLDQIAALFGVNPAKSAKPQTSNYDDLIVDSATRHGVDPDLIRAQMGQESSFNPTALSPVGASGLMQLMPATARRFGVTDIYNPKQNIEGGVKYMRWLLDQPYINGDVRKALAGYNAGEGAVQKYKGIPPYRETRDYVTKITSKYQGNGYHPNLRQPDSRLSDIAGYFDDPAETGGSDVADVSKYFDDLPTNEPSPTYPNGSPAAADNSQFLQKPEALTDVAGNLSALEKQLEADTKSAYLPPAQRKQASEALTKLRAGKSAEVQNLPDTNVQPSAQDAVSITDPPQSSLPKPVPESDFTISEQIKSAVDLNSPRAAVLLTEPNQFEMIPLNVRKQLTPVTTPNGALWVNNQKAAMMGLNTPKDIYRYVKQNGFASLIGKVEPVSDTSKGVAVRTETTDGRELSTSVVQTPLGAIRQMRQDKAEHGDKIGRQEVLPTQNAIARRESETNPFNKVPSSFIENTNAASEQEDADTAALADPNKKVGETSFGTEFSPVSSQPVPDVENEYKKYLKYTKKTDSLEERQNFGRLVAENPELHSEVKTKFDTPQQPNGEQLQNTANLQPTTANAGEIAGKTQNYAPMGTRPEASFSPVALGRTYRQKPTVDEVIADGTAAAYGANYAEADRAYRRIKGTPLNDFTGERDAIEKHIEANYDPETGQVAINFQPLDRQKEIVDAFSRNGEQGIKDLLGQKEANKNQAVGLLPEQEDSFQSFVAAGVMKDTPEDRAKYLKSLNEPNNAAKDEEDGLRAQAAENVRRSPFSTGTAEDVEAEYQWLKGAKLDRDTAESAESDANALNESLGGKGAAVVGGIAGGVSRVNNSVAGVFRTIGFTGGYNLFSKIAQKSNILSEKSGDGSTGAELIKIAASSPFDIARIVGLSRLPGGMIAGFAAEHALQASGSGKSVVDIAKEGAKGAALGGVFGVAGKVGGAAERVARANLVNFVDAFPSNAAYKAANISAKIIGQGYEIGTITGGTYAVEKVAGANDKDAARSAIFNALFHVANKAGAKAYDKVYKIWKNGKANDVYVDPQGNVKLLTGEVAPNYIDAEIITDPQSSAYKASESARNVTPKGRIERGQPAEDFDANQPGNVPNNKPVSAEETISNNDARLGEGIAPRELEAQNPQRIDAPHPEAVREVAKSTHAQKISEIIADGQAHSIESLQKQTRFSRENVENAAMSLYGARAVEMLPDGSIRRIEAQTPTAPKPKTIAERAAEKYQPQTEPIQLSESTLPMETQNAPDIIKPTETPTVESALTKDDENLQPEKQKTVAREDFTAKAITAERPNIGEKLNEFSRQEPTGEIARVGANETDLASVSSKAKISFEANSETKHDFSSTQVNLPKDVSSKVVFTGRKLIKNDDLADSIDWNPRENKPHITVKYGLHADNDAEIRKILENEKPFEVTLGKTSIFPAKEGADYDVVKVDVASPELHKINKLISDNTKTTDTHPTYQPHVTLAYVKKGEGQKYVGDNSLEGQKLTFNSIAFSDKNGNQVDVPLGRKSAGGVAVPAIPVNTSQSETLTQGATAPSDTDSADKNNLSQPEGGSTLKAVAPIQANTKNNSPLAKVRDAKTSQELSKKLPDAERESSNPNRYAPVDSVSRQQVVASIIKNPELASSQVNKQIVEHGGKFSNKNSKNNKISSVSHNENTLTKNFLVGDSQRNSAKAEFPFDEIQFTKPSKSRADNSDAQFDKDFRRQELIAGRELDGYAESKITDEDIVSRAKITFDGDVLKANKPGIELVRRLVNKSSGKNHGSFFGIYMPPNRAFDLSSQVELMRRHELKDFGARAKLREIETSIGEAMKNTHKDLIVVMDSPSSSLVSKYAEQEEKSHRADFRVRNFERAEIAPYEKLDSYNQAVENVRNSGYQGFSDNAIHNEVIAKINRDDAAEILGISQDGVDEIQAVYTGQLIDKGVHEDTIREQYKNISRQSDTFVEKYGQSKHSFERTQAAGSREISPDSRSRAEIRQGGDTNSTKTLEADTDRFARLRQAELSGASRSGNEETGLAKVSSAKLAPNGEKSNLPPHLWEAARTPEFIEQFGDWETNAQREQVEELPPVVLKGNEMPYLPSAKEIVDWSIAHLPSSAANPVLGPVEINKNSYKDTLAHGYGKAKINALPAIAKLVEQGIVVHRQTQNELGKFKGEGYVLASPLKIGDNDFRAFVLVRSDNK